MFLLRSFYSAQRRIQQFMGSMAENGTDSPGQTTENEKDDVPNPVTGLLYSEVRALQDSWSLLFRKEHRKKNSLDFFMILFTHHPEAKELFEDLKNVPMDKLRENKIMSGHSVTVFHALDSFVECIEDTDTLVELVKKQAVNHLRRGIGAKEMEWLIPVVKELLETVLEEDCTQEMLTAWEKILKVLVAVTDQCAKEKAA